MIKQLLKSVREYKKPTVITVILMVFEVIIEVVIPFITANLVNDIKAGAEMSEVVHTGLILVAMSFVSLGCGSAGGFTSARASSGFAKNLRHDVFAKVQSFSFENIDKFSTASLVTRLTPTYRTCSLRICSLSAPRYARR